MDFTPIADSAYYKKHIKHLYALHKLRFYLSGRTLLLFAALFVFFLWLLNMLGVSMDFQFYLTLYVPIPLLCIWSIRNYIQWTTWDRAIKTELITFLERNNFYAGRWSPARDTSKEPVRVFRSLPYKGAYQDGSSIDEEIRGTIAGAPFTHAFRTVKSYWRDRKGGWHEQSESRAIVLQVLLHKPLPTLYVRSKKRTTLSLQYRLVDSLTERKYQVEGDFSNDFIIYGDSDLGVRVFETFSPEVLALIKDNYHCDIWIDSTMLSFIIPLAEYQDFITSIPHLFSLAEKMLQDIDTMQ